MTEGCVDVVDRFSRALGARNLDDARRFLHEDLVVHEAGGLPYSGDYHGPQAFLDLMSTMDEAFELAPGLTTRDSIAADTVVSRLRLRFTARASGRSTETDLVEIYQVTGGQIVDLDVYYKDPSAVAALLDP